MEPVKCEFDRRARRFSVTLYGQTYVSHYEKTTIVDHLLDGLIATWEVKSFTRADLCLLPVGSTTPISPLLRMDKVLAPKNAAFEVGCLITVLVFPPNATKGQPVTRAFPFNATVAFMVKYFIDLLHVEERTATIGDAAPGEAIASFLQQAGNQLLSEFLLQHPPTLAICVAAPVAVEQGVGPTEGLLSAPIELSQDDEEDALERLPKIYQQQKRADRKQAPSEAKKSKQMAKEDARPSMMRQKVPPISLAEKAESSQPSQPSPSPSPPGAPSSFAKTAPPGPSATAKDFETVPEEILRHISGGSEAGASGATPIPPAPKTYTINEALEYYSVMMEKQPYLLYVHLSQQELKIETEEGKTVYQTTFTFVAKKEEPPKLEVRVYGDGFQAHPYSGLVTVLPDAINPPVIIFSVMALPVEKEEGKKKKKVKGPDIRHLHVTVENEGSVVNHTVLAVTVQPKHYTFKIGPLRLSVSKGTANFISVASAAWASIMVIKGIFDMQVSPDLTQTVEGFLPGMASWIVVIMYFIGMAKAIKPLKESWASAFAAGKGLGLLK